MATAPVKTSTAQRSGAQNGVSQKRPVPARRTPPQTGGGSNTNNSSAGGEGVTSAYSIMANRIANRVAEMAESITFVERYGGLLPPYMAMD